MEAIDTFILILHVLGAGVLIGMVFFVALAALRPGWSQERLNQLNYLFAFGKWASLWQLLTGLYLASGEWDEFRESKLFWSKMAAYVLLSLTAGVLQKKISVSQGDRKASGLPIWTISLAAFLVVIVSIGVILATSEHME